MLRFISCSFFGTVVCPAQLLYFEIFSILLSSVKLATICGGGALRANKKSKKNPAAKINAKTPIIFKTFIIKLFYHNLIGLRLRAKRCLAFYRGKRDTARNRLRFAIKRR